MGEVPFVNTTATADGPAARRLVVLGTASQVPTADRNHNGYVLFWDGEAILFDPGEGTQREMTRCGVAAASITRICLTHFHGDHCLGLPGVLQRMGLDGVERPVPICYPAAGEVVLEHLLALAVCGHTVPVRREPIGAGGADRDLGHAWLRARPLRHGTDVLGYRLEEKPGRTLIPERLADLGIAGPLVGELVRAGEVVLDGRRVTVDEVSHPRSGQTAAVVLDTAEAPAIAELLAGADIALVEATFLATEADQAARYLHLTADQAGRLAVEAGVATLVLTHYSARYDDPAAFAAEAGVHHPRVIAARDGTVVAVSRRKRRLEP